MKLLILFVVMNILNVIIQTIKSIATIKCGKWGAAGVNAIAYGLYTYIVVLTMCDIDLLTKCLIVAGANFIGVYVVKLVEEKARKDKLWKVEVTVSKKDLEYLIKMLELGKLPYNYVDLNKKDRYLLNIYCVSQENSAYVKKWLLANGAKYFVSESKTL